MNPLERIAKMQADAEGLNVDVHDVIESITLVDARRLDQEIRSVEDWLLGVRKILLGQAAGG